jgi:hypothetical protein
MPSASEESPIWSCQRETGSCGVRIVAAREQSRSHYATDTDFRSPDGSRTIATAWLRKGWLISNTKMYFDPVLVTCFTVGRTSEVNPFGPERKNRSYGDRLRSFDA